MRIAYHGEPGASSEAAAQRVGAEAECVPCETLDQVFEAVARGRASHGILPIENSIGGSIHRTYDLLLEHELPIVGEVELPVEHTVLGQYGAPSEDYGASVTRYILISRRAIPLATPDKTTIVFALVSAPGALFKALSVFALRDIDLTKLESRPNRRQPWEYLFYADLAIGRDELRCARALVHLAEFAKWVRTLGSYASWKEPEASPPPAV